MRTFLYSGGVVVKCTLQYNSTIKDVVVVVLHLLWLHKSPLLSRLSKWFLGDTLNLYRLASWYKAHHSPAMLLTSSSTQSLCNRFWSMHPKVEVDENSMVLLLCWPRHGSLVASDGGAVEWCLHAQAPHKSNNTLTRSGGEGHELKVKHKKGPFLQLLLFLGSCRILLLLNCRLYHLTPLVRHPRH